MATKTTQFRTILRNLIFNGGSFTAPTQWWLQVYAVNPGNDLSVNPILPQRFQINGWQMEDTNVASNSQVITITNTTSNSVTIAYGSIHTEQTGGVSLYVGPFRPQFILAPNESFSIQPGRLKITLL